MDKLNEKELDFLNSFNEEWINADMNHKGKKLHKTKQKKRECYSRNNARNRDLVNVSRAKGNVPISYDAMPEKIEDMEEYMNLQYDLKYNKSEIKKLHDLENSNNNSKASTDDSEDDSEGF